MLLMQLSAAHGPAECEYAVQLTLRKLGSTAGKASTTVTCVPMAA